MSTPLPWWRSRAPLADSSARSLPARPLQNVDEQRRRSWPDSPDQDLQMAGGMHAIALIQDDRAIREAQFSGAGQGQQQAVASLRVLVPQRRILRCQMDDPGVQQPIGRGQRGAIGDGRSPRSLHRVTGRMAFGLDEGV